MKIRLVNVMKKIKILLSNKCGCATCIYIDGKNRRDNSKQQKMGYIFGQACEKAK